LSPSKKKTLKTICTFFQNNQHRMRYDITLLNAHGIRQRGHFTANVLFNGHVPQGFNDLPVDLR